MNPIALGVLVTLAANQFGAKMKFVWSSREAEASLKDCSGRQGILVVYGKSATAQVQRPGFNQQHNGCVFRRFRYTDQLDRDTGPDPHELSTLRACYGTHRLDDDYGQRLSDRFFHLCP